jgi:hypothetical protein
MPSFPSAGRMFGVGLDVMSDVDVSDVEDKLFSSLLRAVGGCRQAQLKEETVINSSL